MINRILFVVLALAATNARALTIISPLNSDIVNDRVIAGIPSNTEALAFTQADGNPDTFYVAPGESLTPGETATYAFVPRDPGGADNAGPGTANADLRELFAPYYPVIGAPLEAEHASVQQHPIAEIFRRTFGPPDVSSPNSGLETP
ncbi:MAG TPA: hypothetical protein VMH81_05705 [Bryobacteraceae bacterium]|nr:hypothetical protein [Bryobacteraceae bacterium]